MRTIFTIFFRDIKRLCSNWVAVLVVLGVCLIPSLYAWFNIAANMDPYSNTQGIRIAVANCDRGADNEMTGELHVGDQIIENLKKNDALGWTFMDREQAIAGVDAGRYYAAIVIPENFSESLVSVLSGDLQSPEIEYYLNEKKNAIAPKVTDTGATTVQQQVNQTFVSVASEAVSKMLDETVFSASQSISQTNRKSAANVRKAAQRLQEQQAVLQRLTALTEAGEAIIAETDRTLQKSKRAADESAMTLDQSLDTLAAVRQAVNAFSIQMEGILARADAQLAQAGAAVDTQIAQMQSQLAAAEGQLNRLIPTLQTVIDQNERMIAQLKELNEQYRNETLAAAISFLEGQNQQYVLLKQSMQQTVSTLQNASEQLTHAQTSIGGALQSEQTGLYDSKEILNTEVFPPLNRALDVLALQGGTLSGVLSSMEPTLSQMQTILGELDSCIKATQAALGTTAVALQRVTKRVAQAADEISALRSADAYRAYTDFLQARGLHANVIADFISSPVELTTKSLFPVKNYGSAMTPFYTNLAIWVSGIVLIAIFKLEVDRDKRVRNFTPTQAYFGRWMLFIMVGLVQALIICLGDIFLLKAQCEHPLAFIGAGLWSSFVYVNLIYALSITFKHIGKAVCVILVILQIPGSAGTYPIEMTPTFFRSLHPLLPFTYGINAMREAMAGMYGNLYWKDLGRLSLFLPIAFLLGLGVRLLMLNLNRMFDKKLEETGLMMCEESGMTRERVKLSTALQILADQETFRDKMIEKAKLFEKNYQKWTKIGFLLILLLPTVFLVLMFSVTSKMVFLVLWICAIIAIAAFLIILEFIHENLQKKMRYAQQSKEDLIDAWKGELKL